MNNNVFITINEINFDKIGVTNVDDLCLEKNLKYRKMHKRKLRNISIEIFLKKR